MAIKALMFDVFGTVVDWRSSVAREAQALLESAKGIEADWFAFADGWRAKYLPAMARVGRGALPCGLCAPTARGRKSRAPSGSPRS